jgi:hypothetical protein
MLSMNEIFAGDWKQRLNICGKQKTAADALSISEAAVSKWGPKFGTVAGVEEHVKLAEAYGVSPAWLAWGDGPMDRAAYERALELGVVLETVPPERREAFIDATMTLAGLTYPAATLSSADEAPAAAPARCAEAPQIQLDLMELAKWLSPLLDNRPSVPDEVWNALQAAATLAHHVAALPAIAREMGQQTAETAAVQAAPKVAPRVHRVKGRDRT